MSKFVLRGALPAVALLVLPFSSAPRAQTPQASFDKGQKLAAQTLQEQARHEGVELLADRDPLGVIVAEGDSWFAYPGLDVMSALKGQTLPNRDWYRVFSAANAGDTVESMAYDRHQREGFWAEFDKVRDAGLQAQVRAILLSGPGRAQR